MDKSNLDSNSLNKIFHFPSEDELTKCLRKNRSFNDDWAKRHKIAEHVAPLAAKRFENKELTQEASNLGAYLVVDDLSKGEDGFTKEKLPKVEFPDKIIYARFLASVLRTCSPDYVKPPRKTTNLPHLPFGYSYDGDGEIVKTNYDADGKIVTTK